MTEPVVPWVALWSGEKNQCGSLMTTPAGIAGPRDSRGLRWIDFPPALGAGRPMFAEMHTVRQVRCMRGPRCQVCGEKMAKTPTTWVLNGEMDAPQLGGPILTQTPPTCLPCIEKAKELCPHLRSLERAVAVSATKWREVGVCGDLYQPGMPPEGPGLLFHYERTPKELAKWFLARLVVVELTEYEEVEP